MKDLIVENRKGLNGKILELITHAEIGEEFRTEAQYKFVGKYKDKLIGIVAYEVVKLEIDGETNEYPRFIHVIIHPDFRRKRILIPFLIQTERILNRDGYFQTMAYIKTEKAQMMELAMKFGYKQYAEDTEGKFFYKNIS